MRDLGAPAGVRESIASAIDEDLTVVGYAANECGPKWTHVSGPGHAWVWERGRMIDFGSSITVHDIKEAVDIDACGVNDAGAIVGCSRDNAVR